jgi:hypothetical protein
MIHTAVTTIRYQSVSFDSILSSTLIDSTIPSQRVAITDLTQAPNDENQDEEALASGTWYEPALENNGPMIDETYCQTDLTFSPMTSSISDSQTSESSTRRRSLQTTVVSPPPQRKMSAYQKISVKLNDFSLNLPGQGQGQGQGQQRDELHSNLTSLPLLSEMNVERTSATTPSSSSSSSSSSQQKKKVLNELEKMNSTDSIEITDEREAFSELPRRVISSSGLDRPDIENLVRTYSRPLICNHHLLRDGTQMIIDLYNKWNLEEHSRNQSATSTSSSSRHPSLVVCDVLCDDTLYKCSLEQNEEELIEILMLKESIYDVCEGLIHALELCNLDLSKRWSLVLSSLPKVMKDLVENLRGKYVHGMRAFWKGQCLLFRCRSSKSTHSLSLHIFPLLTSPILASHSCL